MPLWGSPNPPLVVYHGTDDQSLLAWGPIIAGRTLTGFRARVSLCRPFTDFGQGFYVTTWDHQARQWANARVLRILAPTGPQPRAVVIRFLLDRDWLADLDSLVFIRPTFDFWNLVDDCRTGFPPHQRPGPYDVVYGPVALWDERLLIQDCDQIGFHTRRAVRRLVDPSVYAIATTVNGRFPR
jgi:hypothetical protein